MKLRILKVFCRVVLILCCLSIFSSCDDEEDYTSRIDVLVIGNSYSRDAFSYVPDVIYSVNSDVAVHLDILGIGGSNLEDIYKDLINKKKTFQFDEYSVERRHWITDNDTKGLDVIKGKRDLIVLQENSVVATDYESTRKNVSKMVTLLRKYNPNAKTAFMINPTHPVGSTSLGDMTIDEEFFVISKVAQNLQEEGLVDFLIPCGTAIQNARHSYLNGYGDCGQLSYDGKHLQEGLPCLTEAYTSAQFILNSFSLNGSFLSSDLFITDSWIKSKRIPGQHGKAVTGTVSDYVMCKKCAFSALESPYLITDF